MTTFPKRLIEVDLPIKRISAHARREKSIRHGHISTLHVWWARRPLAACRAVICASLWPDPADPLCPDTFRAAARHLMTTWAFQHWGLASAESYPRLSAIQNAPEKLGDNQDLRVALLDFIADFADWDNATKQPYLDTSRALTQVAHEALGGEPGTRPLVVDPFAGGGSIPLEALRVGADAFASDLNPVAVLLNKVVLEYAPRYGQRLADEVRKWGAWVKEQAEQELAEFYPKDPDGAIPIAYLWARTIMCEGPGCGVEVPLMRSLWLCKKASRPAALEILATSVGRQISFRITEPRNNAEVREGTVRRGSATCPACGFTTPVAAVRRQLKARRGGTTDARLIAVVTTRPGQARRFYRLATQVDLQATRSTAAALAALEAEHDGKLSPVPDEPLDTRGVRHTWAMIYGLERWRDYFTPRQALALATLARLVRGVCEKLRQTDEGDIGAAIQTCLALAVSRMADRASSLCTWRPQADQEKVEHVFARQALPMNWDFAEGTPLSDGTAGWQDAYEPPARLIDSIGKLGLATGVAVRSSATCSPFPDGSVNAVITDPPYYDSVPYSYLSDYFYAWIRRSLGDIHSDLFASHAVPKEEEVVVDRLHRLSNSTKDVPFYELELTKAFAEGRRMLQNGGLGIIVFASKTVSSWEAFVQAVINAGWTITGSWPIDTEMATRVAAQGQARLGSSVHLACRPRDYYGKHDAGPLIGDWRDVIAELPGRIHDWLPRLVAEGVVGADAIFACLGPALEIFSRYDRVEKASGEQVELEDFLEHVWAAVAHEALGMIFSTADISGFEPDARLTAMWLWTLVAGAGLASEEPDDALGDEDDGDVEPPISLRTAGFSLEYDAARKIAQGLGAHLERLSQLVEVKGDMARLLSVRERERFLPGDHQERTHLPLRMMPAPLQPALFSPEELATASRISEPEDRDLIVLPGKTTLDRVHQSMLFFAPNRSEMLRRLLVEEGVGRDTRYWHLAQALSALYPVGSEEKRWVDGVLARKKALGF